MTSNPYALQIARLETELEAMRQRAEAAEAALGKSTAEWHTAIAPLSLYQTRILRILVKRDVLCCALPELLGEDSSVNSVRSLICTMRRLLPANIVPPTANGGRGCFALYTIPDRPALAEFLASGVMPMRRAA